MLRSDHGCVGEEFKFLYVDISVFGSSGTGSCHTVRTMRSDRVVMADANSLGAAMANRIDAEVKKEC